MYLSFGVRVDSASLGSSGVSSVCSMWPRKVRKRHSYSFGRSCARRPYQILRYGSGEFSFSTVGVYSAKIFAQVIPPGVTMGRQP
jgi:hypothetical protein